MYGHGDRFCTVHDGAQIEVGLGLEVWMILELIDLFITIAEGLHPCRR
jgi:hypothetical protein